MANGVVATPERVGDLRKDAAGRARRAELRDSSRSVAICAVASAASALMFELVGTLPNLWMCALIAPLPILATAPEVSTARAAQFAFLAYFVGNLASWGGESFAVPLMVLLASHLAGAIVFATFVACAAEATRRWSGVMATLMFPTVVTAFYYTLGNVSPHGTWGSPAYSQVDFIPLLQTASVTGLGGIIFVMSILPAGLAIAWYRRRWSMAWKAPAILGVGVFVLAVLLGWMRLLGWDRLVRSPAVATVRVGLVASDRLLALYESESAIDAAEVVAMYSQLVRKVVDARTQVVVLPEKIVGMAPAGERFVTAGLARIASDSHVWLVVGVNEIARDPRRNLALVFNPEGKLVAAYAKRHLIESLEFDYKPGSKPAIFDAPWGRTAVLICKDLDFPETARELARAGVKVVLAPAWDWPGSEEIHERMAVVRGVEMGFSVARSGRQGMVSATDSRGRVIAAQATSREQDALATVDLPIGIGMTSYARVNDDWFGQFTVGLTIILMLRLGVSIWYAARIRRLKSVNRIAPTGVVSVDVAGNPQPQHAAAAPVEEAEERIYRVPKRPPE